MVALDDVAEGMIHSIYTRCSFVQVNSFVLAQHRAALHT